MAKKKKPVINLLPKEEFAFTTAGRVLAWILSTFRIIVIVTEILVMVAFLSRFWLDARNSDLTEIIKQKQAVLAAARNFEDKFKDTQTRLKVFSDYAIDEGVSSNILSKITESMPSDIFLSSVTFSENMVSINGASPGETSIQQFIVNLEAKDLFEDISLDEIRTSQEEELLLLFKISIPTETKEK